MLRAAREALLARAPPAPREAALARLGRASGGARHPPAAAWPAAAWPARSPAQAQNWSAAAHEAALLGLDEATYRLLCALEEREITPEDYELLSRLDDTKKVPTLDCQELSRFPVEKYCPAHRDQRDGLACLGADFWRLPLPPIHEAMEDEATSCKVAACFGMDFWRLPLPPAAEEARGGAAEATGSEDHRESPGCVCGVCLVEFEAGDELRVLLPCRHRFHRECIDHWLTECSTACPVDKRDLRRDG